MSVFGWRRARAQGAGRGFTLAATLLAAVMATAAPSLSGFDAARADATRDAVASFRFGELRGMQVHEAPELAPPLVFLNADGAETTFDAYRGRALLVNFWATWCAPCLHEMPMIDELVGMVEAEGLSGDVEVLTINIDFGDGARAASWLEQNGITRLPLLRAPDPSAPQVARLRGMPTTLVIDQQGREVARVEGAADWNAAEVVAMLRALAEAAPAG